MESVDPQSRGAVLVVGDDEDLRDQLRETLEWEQYFVLEAEDDVDALSVLRSNYAPIVRLVILDLVTPFMTGWQLIDILRRDAAFSRIRVLVMSADPHDHPSGIGATMSWLRKPFGEEALLAAVKRALESASSEE